LCPLKFRHLLSAGISPDHVKTCTFNLNSSPVNPSKQLIPSTEGKPNLVLVKVL